jgi:hypothetical protein
MGFHVPPRLEAFKGGVKEGNFGNAKGFIGGAEG